MTQASTTATPEATVLIVDDNPSNLGFLVEHFEDSGFRVLVALSGDEALEQLEHIIPDVILLDVMMPGIDGFETCKRIKGMHPTEEIPVIFMSALTEPEQKVQAFNAGAVDYVTKPVNKEEVLARAHTQVELVTLQRELKQRNAQLRERNEALSAFGHMLAHDLNSSLHRILGFTSLLLDQAEGNNGLVELKHLRRVYKAGLEMQGLTTSMMMLGGIAQEEVELGPLDMGAIVGQIKQALSAQIAERGARITGPDDWPKAMGYAPWIEQVWHNYISNGMKYGGEPPQLTLGADALDPQTIRFWIRDNGAGIPDTARTKIFEPFFRLQPDREDGHGLGLTIVERIVTKLGGTVGARPLDNGGSELYFTLPAA